MGDVDGVRIPVSLAGLAVPVESLRHYSRNPRQGDVGAIVESLRTHGQYRPIVANSRDRVVLAGNHTLRAARELGWSEVAVTWVDVDDDQAARIVLVDNRLNDVAAYDDSALADLLGSLPDLAGTGFDGDDLDDLLKVFEPVDRPEPVEVAQREQRCPSCGFEWVGDGDAFEPV